MILNFSRIEKIEVKCKNCGGEGFVGKHVDRGCSCYYCKGSGIRIIPEFGYTDYVKLLKRINYEKRIQPKQEVKAITGGGGLNEFSV